ncbi:MAG: metallophosphoesterase [Candidatus Hydrogenedentota bacterium]
MSIRLIHTADVHLDLCYAHAGMPPVQANNRRQSLRDSLRTVVRRAGEWPADALLIAGDLFEHHRVSPDTIAFLKDVFDRIPDVAVFIAPGNHDPYTPDSPYATESWPGNVTIFSQPSWQSKDVSHALLTVHGFAFDGPDLSENPFGQLDVPQDSGRVHVAVGHGSASTHQPPDKGAYAPFDPGQAAAPGLAYLALGHFHTVTELEGNFPTRMCYSGAPEGHGFGECGPRHFLEVEIDEGRPRVRQQASAHSIYEQHTLDVSTFSNSQAVLEAVRDLPAPAEAARLVRIVLEGACPPSMQERLKALPDVVGDQFAYLDIVDRTTAQEDYEDLAHEATSLGMFIQQMNDAIAAAAEPERRRMLERARYVGLAAYRGEMVPVRGTEGG